jgi:uncharacterized repeat protein (TIGR01451 family)
MSLTDSPDPVASGGNLTYKATALNNGPDAASSVSVQTPIPTGTTFVSMTAPSGWSLTTPPLGGTGTATATNGTMGTFTGAIFTLVVHTTTPGPFTETATISSATPDPNPSNNSATVLSNEPASAPVPPASTPTHKKKCKKKRRSAAAAKKRCKKKR